MQLVWCLYANPCDASARSANNEPTRASLMPLDEKKKKRPKPASALSFDLDDEGESFEVKKSKPRGHKHARTRPDAEATSGVDTAAGSSGGTYTAEHLEQLRASMKFTSVPAAPPADEPAEVRRAASRLSRAHRPAPRVPPQPTAGLAACARSLAQGPVPNADDIRKARAERERARRLAEEAGGRGLAGPEGAEFIPLEGSAPSESRDGSRTGRYGESRFVREDQERDDDDNPAFDDQAGATLSFGQPASGARTPRPEVTTVQDVDDDDESGAAGTRRPAHAISQSDRRDRATSSQSLAEHAAFLADASRAAQLPERLDDAARRLGHQLSALQHEHKETARLLQVRIHADDGSPRELFSRALQQVTHQPIFSHPPAGFCQGVRRAGGPALHRLATARVSSARAGMAPPSRRPVARRPCSPAPSPSPRVLQAYVEDLLACLTEKGPLIEECEGALCDALEAHHRSARRVEVELMKLEHERAATALRGEWRGPALDSAAPTPATTAEATQQLARLDAAHGCEHDGWSSSDEHEAAALFEDARDARDERAGLPAGGPARVLRQQVQEVLAAGDDVFADTAPEFCEVKLLVRRFAEWRTTHPAAYRDAYIASCLPTMIAPLVRLQLLRWWPLEQGSVESLSWHAAILQGWEAVGGLGDGGADDAEARILLARLSCKLALPRLKHVVAHSWRVHSRRQGGEIRRGVRELVGAAEYLRSASERLRGVDDDEADALAVDEQEATAAVRELLLQVAMRLETATTETSIPPCAAPDPKLAASDDLARGAALRQLWRALKLMQTMSDWSELLAPAALQDLVAALLVSQVVPYLREQLASRPPRMDLVVDACERALGALPETWRRVDAHGSRLACVVPVHRLAEELGRLLAGASAADSAQGALLERATRMLRALG